MSHLHSNNKQSQRFGEKFASGETSYNRKPSNDQRKFVPKHRSTNPTSVSTLSHSFRQASSSNTPSFHQQLEDARKSPPDTEKNSASIDRPPVSSVNFVRYLPHDEAVAVGLPTSLGGLDPSDSQAAVDHLNKELSRLLKMNPRGFWREVASDTSLHDFLDSYLQFRSRWYDFPYHSAKGTISGVIVGDNELSRRVFMILFRMSSNKDPNAKASDAINKRDHAAILQENNLLSMPKLLDICAIYGHENKDITGQLVRNAVNSQCNLHESFTSLVSHFMSIVNTMNQRCVSSIEILFSMEGSNNKGAQLLQDLLQVMDFINDSVVSLDSFITAYKSAAPFFSSPIETSFGNEELPVTLARLHDTLLPSFERAFKILLREEEEHLVSNVSMSLKMLSSRLVALGWKLLYCSYMSEEAFQDLSFISKLPKVFPPLVDDSLIRGEVLTQLLREISSVFLYAQENQSWRPFLHKLEILYHFSDHLGHLQTSGWMVIDDEQNHFISEVMNSPLISSSSINRNSSFIMVEEQAILESKINQIKDLFPELGNGYLTACLEVYNQNAEEVIQRILEGTLHEELTSLSTSLEIEPPSKAPLALLPTNKEKGKAKIVDETEPHSSSSSTGKFIRKPNVNTVSYEISSSNDASIRNAVLAYEDEYDDSFDDLGMTIAVEDTEVLSERMNSNAGTSSKNGAVFGERKKPQYYVKDGKNYSYKVSGGVAVGNSKEAELVNRAQEDMIHGLGRGGNIPLGAVKDLMDHERNHGNESENAKVGESGGRGSRGRGRGSHQFRKDRAFKKHFNSVSGF